MGLFFPVVVPPLRAVLAGGAGEAGTKGEDMYDWRPSRLRSSPSESAYQR
jgi:hypothetical protein